MRKRWPINMEQEIMIDKDSYTALCEISRKKKRTLDDEIRLAIETHIVKFKAEEKA